ncbi:MAG: hypothetical protein GXO69_08050 [Acidobacteria bacterium]|nr:hypothetical protein [Acidobacteriota bacterium]
MVEKLKGQRYLKIENFLPLLLLVLVFPPVFRDMLLTVQKLQLLLFLALGGVVLWLYHKEEGGVLTVLLYLFVWFPLGYAVVGFFCAYSPYVIFKEVLFFIMPIFMYVLFRRFFASEGWVRALVLFAVFAAVLQLAIWFEIRLIAGGMHRTLYRWEVLCMSYPILSVSLWLIAGNSHAGVRRQEWGMIALLFLGILATSGRRDLVAVGALMLFAAGGFFRSERKMGCWILLLSAAPVFYLLLLNHGVQLPGKHRKDWRVYEVQTFFQSTGPGQLSFWTGHGLGWELPVKRKLHVYRSETLPAINKFHDFWLYLLAKTGVIGAFVFWAGLLFLFFSIKRRVFKRFSGNFPIFLLGYLAFLCFASWNYDGGVAMAFQQSALFGMALAVTQLPDDGACPVGGSR